MICLSWNWNCHYMLINEVRLPTVLSHCVVNTWQLKKKLAFVACSWIAENIEKVKAVYWICLLLRPLTAENFNCIGASCYKAVYCDIVLILITRENSTAKSSFPPVSVENARQAGNENFIKTSLFCRVHRGVISFQARLIRCFYCASVGDMNLLL